MTTAALLPPDLVSLEDNSFFDHEESEANQSIERPAQPHPFDGMHFDSEDDQPDDDEVDEDQDEDYAEDDSFSLPPQASLHQQHDQPIPPPIPTHSRPPRLPAPKFHNPLPVANSAHRAANQSRAVILPTNHRQPQNKPRQARRVSPTNPPLIASSRPSNVRRAGAPSHRATLSVSSQGLGDAGDPSIPDPNEEGIIMISGAQAMHMTFLDFGANMYLIRKDLTDPLYPSFLEPPSKLTPLRCLCCKKVYNGPNARSMWRRHITQKHQFILGGKKGNGKGKKEVVDDENRFPGETAEEAILRRREQALQMKREWSRNRRLSNRAAQEENQAFAVPKMMARSVSFGSQPLNTDFLQHGVSFDQLNAEPLAQWQSSGSLVEMSRGGARAYGHPRNVTIPSASDVEDDDEDDEPLSNQLSIPIQTNELEPSPALDSPQAASFTPLPESGAASEDAQHGPQLVENEEPSKNARSELHQAHLFQHLGSEFEYDFVLGTSPVVAITQLPVLSQPKDQHLNGLPELSYSFTRPLLPGTPARIAPTRQLTDAERRNILSLESPRGIPFPRSKTSAGIVGGVDLTTRPTVSTPARPSGMMRSVTMPALALHSTPLASDTSLQSLMPETPGNGSVSYLDHMPPTPFRDILGGSWDWHMFESPVVKRKRSQTDEGPVSTKDSTTNVLSSTTLNTNIGGDMHVAIMEGDFFEKFFDLPKTPGKKGLGFSEAGGSENVAVLAEDGAEDGRKAKRARFI
ncbi:hypothetical protein FS837_004189 [Tulasnella sp. UAMH 9824]|nr:hypothetical protein FS837_004189 [Tulasnella sp. UAMH 9824]